MPFAPLSREALGDQLHVSRETLERLTVYLELLRRWQRAINLVGPRRSSTPGGATSSMPSLRRASRRRGELVDLGSGAGFPGMVLAILGVRGVDLIESDRRKAQFLREVARETGASVGCMRSASSGCRVAGRCHHRTRARAFAAPARAGRAVPDVRQRLPFPEGTVRRA